MSTARPPKALHISLWIAQILLAAMFFMTGLMKLMLPIDTLAAQMQWPGQVPAWLVRFIGLAEVLGGLGLLLPSLLRRSPVLTGWAALGLVLVMVLAAVFHLFRGESPMIPLNLMIGLLAAFVAWGRFKAAPIWPKTLSTRSLV